MHYPETRTHHGYGPHSGTQTRLACSAGFQNAFTSCSGGREPLGTAQVLGPTQFNYDVGPQEFDNNVIQRHILQQTELLWNCWSEVV